MLSHCSSAGVLFETGEVQVSRPCMGKQVNREDEGI